MALGAEGGMGGKEAGWECGACVERVGCARVRGGGRGAWEWVCEGNEA